MQWQQKQHLQAPPRQRSKSHAVSASTPIEK
jgi:hypothetical protein